MDDKKYDKILEGITKIEISQAVTHEKLTNMDNRLDRTNKRLDHANDAFEKIEKRVDFHDKVVGAIVLAVAILGVLVKYKII